MTKKKKFIIFITVLAVIVVSTASYSAHRLSQLYNITDKRELNNMADEVASHQDDVKDTATITKLLTDWCDVNNLKCTVDSNKNVILSSKASNRKDGTPASVVAMEYNAKTFQQDICAYTSAEYLAKHGMNGSDVKVIFLYNDENLHTGARNLSKKYIPKNSRIVLLSQGEDVAISRNSYANAVQTVSVPYRKTARYCDSALRIKIGGLNAATPSGDTLKQTNPISCLSTILTRLRTKSISFQLADVKVQNNGNMSPSGIEATILLNSYSMESVTTYLDDRIEDFEDDNKKDFPDSYYEYTELTTLPSYAYSDGATNKLSNFLYTVKSGAYRFDKENVPDGSKEGDLYGFNSIQNLCTQNGKLCVRLSTSAQDSSYLEQIVKENRAAASLSDVKLETEITDSPYQNGNSNLYQLVEDAYTKVNDTSTVDATIPEEDDETFTVMTYLASKSKGTDAVHVTTTDKAVVRVMNALENFPMMDRNIFGF